MKNRSKPSANRWGIPDWRKPELYPKPQSDDSDLWQWKWQFLRRHKEYRDDWFRFRALEHPFQLALYNDPTDDHFDLPRYPTKYPDRHADVWHALKKYKLARLLNPSISNPRTLRFYPTPGEGVFVCFDLQCPLKDQLRRAETRVKFRQKERFNKLLRARLAGKSKWPMYLRVLDALSEKVIYETIGYEILGVNEKVKGPEAAMRNTESALITAKTLWHKIPVKSWPSGSRELAKEIDFDDFFPPDVRRPIESIHR